MNPTIEVGGVGDKIKALNLENAHWRKAIARLTELTALMKRILSQEIEPAEIAKLFPGDPQVEDYTLEEILELESKNISLEG